MKTTGTPLIAAALTLALAGCTFLGDGAGWATVDAQVATQLVVDDDHQDASADLITDQGFAVWLDALSLRVAGVALLTPATETSSGGASFDPADPPPGYTLCHGGHCHRADGSIASYEEVEAELASGGAGSSDAVQVSLDASGELELGEDQIVQAAARPVGAFVLSGAAVLCDQLTVEARVEIDGQQVPLHIALAPENAALVRAGSQVEGLPVTLGEDGPAKVHLALTYVEDGSFFDGIRYSNLVQDTAAIHIDQDHVGNAAAWELCLAKLGVLPIQVQAETE